MLEICKRHTDTAQGRIRLGLCVSVIFIVAMVFGLLVMAKPYAVYASGEKVSDPWVVKVNGQEVVVVDSRESGEAVIAGVKAAYIPDVTGQQETPIGETVSVEKYQFDDKSTHPVVMGTEDAVAHITKMNATDKSTPIAVETKKEVTETVEVPYTTETVETDDLYEGDTTTHQAGKNGSNTVVSEVTMVNGKEVSKKALTTTVDKAPVAEIIYKGTKARETEVAANTGSGSSYSSGSSGSSGGSSASYTVPSSRNGAAVASFACQFVGNPYVSGGTSLTNGADCSGFTQSVFAEFGVSLPRVASAQGGVGVAVPAGQAQPGDLVCYGYHVGIYIGGGQMVHASTPSGGIKIGTVSWGAHTFRRVI
ncbi:MAG: NlpC/P60 family protein [Anaerovoracaceae bacterium]|jgi:cell wall-associated NlpC family hydrolase